MQQSDLTERLEKLIWAEELLKECKRQLQDMKTFNYQLYQRIIAEQKPLEEFKNMYEQKIRKYYKEI